MRSLILRQLAGTKRSCDLLSARFAAHIVGLHFLQHHRKMCGQRGNAHAHACTQQRQRKALSLWLQRQSRCYR